VDLPINISGLLVHARPDRAAALREQLLDIPGLEIHAITPEGRFVVTLENVSDREMTDAFARVQTMPDVLSASLIYHHSEDPRDAEPSAQEPRP
jgi:nitrate reductase NapD